MRTLILWAIAALAAFGQQGIGNDQALQDAIAKALLKNMETSRALQNLPLLRRPSTIVIVNAPPIMCAVPLHAVPIPEADNRIIVQPAARDSHMIVSTMRPCGQ